MNVVVPYVRVLEEPAGEPVTLALAKEWCRVDTDDQDAVLNLLIKAARERAEAITGRALVQRTLELRLDSFPEGGVIELPFAPLIAVEYVSYLDSNGALQTLTGSPSNWIEDAGSEPGRIQPLAGQQWPATQAAVGAVRIGYECGYAPPAGSPTDFGGNVPAAIKLWMNARMSTWYDLRNQIDMSNLAALPRDFVDGLLDGLKVNLGFA